LSTPASANIVDFGAIPNDPTKGAINQAAIAAAFAASNSVTAPPGVPFYTQSVLVPVGATRMHDVTLIAGGAYAGGDAVISVANNLAGFEMDRCSATVAPASYPNTDCVQISGSSKTVVDGGTFNGGAHAFLLNTNRDMLIKDICIDTYTYNGIIDPQTDAAGSRRVRVNNARIMGGTAPGSGFNGTAIVFWNGIDIELSDCHVEQSQMFSYCVQQGYRCRILRNVSINSVREAIAATGNNLDVSYNDAFFDATHTDYGASFANTGQFRFVDNNFYGPRYSGVYFNHGAWGEVRRTRLYTPATAQLPSNGWAAFAMDGSDFTGMLFDENSVQETSNTYAWAFWTNGTGGVPSGNLGGTMYGSTPTSGWSNNSILFNPNGVKLRSGNVWSPI